MSKLCNDITETIGNTPIIRLHHKVPDQVFVLVKQESLNPGGSIKDRIALSIIEAAEQQKQLPPHGTIIEATSGNTGIGLALIGAAKGYRVIIVMPDSLSIERRKMLTHLGAELHLTPAAEGMKGAIARSRELRAKIPGSFIANQFTNKANPLAHIEHTGPEIIRTLADAELQLDYFVAGVGTGGTITGCGAVLKRHYPNLSLVAVEPERSQVLAGGTPASHGIQGIGAGFIPEIMNVSILDEVIPVSTEQAIEEAKDLASSEGIICGISSGASVSAALKIAHRPSSRGKVILAILPDTGERYLSTALFNH